MGHNLNLKLLEPLFAGLPELLTAPQIEERVQIDRKTVYAKAKRGELPYVRIGRHIRFPKRQVVIWLAQNTYIPPRIARLYSVEASSGETDGRSAPLMI